MDNAILHGGIEDLNIIKEDPEKRRKFIDKELCQLKPSYYAALVSYKKVLQQRNAYLKENNIDESILEIWDVKLAEYGTKIIIQRADFIKKINEMSRKIHSSITGGKEYLEIFYEPSVRMEMGDSVPDRRKIEELFLDSFYHVFTNKGNHTMHQNPT